MIKVIVFDLWSTLQYSSVKIGHIKWMQKIYFKKHSVRKVRKSYEELFQLDKSDDFQDKHKKLFNKLKVKYDNAMIKECAFYRERIEKTGKFYKYSLPLLRKLKKKGYKIALLSNITHLRGEFLKKSVLKNYIDKYFFSYELKSIKPSAKNFKSVLSYFKVKPFETIMIGDNYQDDFLASKKLGINAIHLKNEHQLMKDLRKLGVLN